MLIRRSEALHRTLTANLPDTTVFLLDHDLRILIADGEAIRRLGWLDEDMFRGRLVAELYAEVPEEVLQLCSTTYRAALEGERRAFEFVSEGLTFSVQAVPVRADDGSVESVLVVARDVTERTHAEQQLARHARQQNAVAELGRFALESHDLGELMTEAVTTATATLGVERRPASWSSTRPASGSRWRPPSACPTARSAHRRCRSTAARASAAHTLRTGEPTIVEDMATETRFQPSADAARARRRQQPQRPDRGPRPAVRGPRRQRPRAARVHRGRGRVPHRRRDADHRSPSSATARSR